MIQQTNQQQHPYYDHSIDVDNAAEMNSTSTGTGTSAGNGRTPFTEKLFQMLTHIDLYEPHLASIVSWQPHGRCFLVRDVKRFEENILPRFFKMTMYTSFRRQLHLWGFKRLVQKTPDYSAYYHELYLRSKPLLLRNIVRNRQRSKDVGAPPTIRATSNPNGEPDFYSMISLPPSACSAGTSNSTNITAALLHNDAVNARSSSQVTSTSSITSTRTSTVSAGVGGGILSYEQNRRHSLPAAGAGISSYENCRHSFPGSATLASRPVSFADNLSSSRSSSARANDQQDLSSPQKEEEGCDLFSLLDYFSCEHQRRSLFLRLKSNSNSSGNILQA
jgi:hypothetical protein